MSSYIEGFVGRVDAETVDVHHARHYRGRRTVGCVRRTRRDEGSGQNCGNESAELNGETFRSRTIYVVQ